VRDSHIELVEIGAKAS